MAKVSELKDQAREYERQGDTDKALTIYQHILSHLEGTPALARELPLYVKVGDLLLKRDRPDDAVAAYERGAEEYARHGSAKSVIALCLKILRADPARTDAYLAFAKALLDHGHVAATREVLADYAKRAKLERTADALRDVEGKPDAEVRAVVERLLAGEDAETSEPAAAEPGDVEEEGNTGLELEPRLLTGFEPVSAPQSQPPASQFEDEPQREAEPEPAQEEEPEPEPSLLEQFEPTTPPEREPETEAPAEPVAPPRMSEPRRPPEARAPEPEPEALAREPEPEPEALAPSRPSAARAPAPRESGPRPSSPRPSGPRTIEPRFGSVRDRQKRSRVPLVVMLIVVVLVAAALALSKLGYFSRGEMQNAGNGPTAPMAESTAVETSAAVAPTTGAIDTGAAAAMGAAPESVRTGQVAAVPESAQTAARQRAVPESVTARPQAAPTTPTVVPAGGAVAGTPAPPTTTPAAQTPAPAAQTPAAAEPADTVTAAPPVPIPTVVPEAPQATTALPTASPLAGPLVVVDGLAIDSVAGSDAAYTVWQHTTDGTPVTLTASAVGPGVDSVGAGAARVSAASDSTATGSERFWATQVTLRSAVPADSVRAFLRRLAMAHR